MMNDLRYNGFANLLAFLNRDFSKILRKIGEGLLYWNDQFPKDKQMLRSQTRFQSPLDIITEHCDEEILSMNNLAPVESHEKSKKIYRKFVRSL